MNPEPYKNGMSIDRLTWYFISNRNKIHFKSIARQIIKQRGNIRPLFYGGRYCAGVVGEGMNPEPYKNGMSINRLTWYFISNRNKIHFKSIARQIIKQRGNIWPLFYGGRYWTWTSDPHNVDVMRYQLRQPPTNN